MNKNAAEVLALVIGDLRETVDKLQKEVSDLWNKNYDMTCEVRRLREENKRLKGAAGNAD